MLTVKNFNHTYLITFKDYDDTVLSAERVVEWKMPTAPSVTPRQGYQFTGWSPSVGVVTQDQIYTAQYQALPDAFYGVRLTNSDTSMLNSLCQSHIATKSASFGAYYRVNKNGDTSYVYTISNKCRNSTNEYWYAVARMPNSSIASSTFAFVLQSDLKSWQYPFSETNFKDAFSRYEDGEMYEMTNTIRNYITTLSYT